MTQIAQFTGGYQKVPFVIGGSNLYFIAAEGLWKTDGTTSGTSKIADVVTSSDGFNLAWLKGHVYFTAYTAHDGRQLWSSDGTSPVPVAIISRDANPQSLTAFGDRLYFVATHNVISYVKFRAENSGRPTGLLKAPDRV
jgi:ELWxxDGT repeat protein